MSLSPSLGFGRCTRGYRTGGRMFFSCCLFLQQMARVLSASGHVFLLSGVREVRVDLCARVGWSAGLRRATGDEVSALARSNGCEEPAGARDAAVFDAEGWIALNPTTIPTEREVHAQADGESVYRALFRKKEQ